MRHIKSYQIFFLGVVFLFSFFSCEKEAPLEKIFLNIEIQKLPEKTNFQLGEMPDFNGLEIVEVYTDGTKKPTANFEVNCSRYI